MVAVDRERILDLQVRHGILHIGRIGLETKLRRMDADLY
jgi:hypothetical protein